MTNHRPKQRWEPEPDADEVWICPVCGAECNPDYVGAKCPACGAPTEDIEEDT